MQVLVDYGLCFFFRLRSCLNLITIVTGDIDSDSDNDEKYIASPFV